MDEHLRWEFLYKNPGVLDPGWLPPAAEVEELADLRAEHERLLAAREKAEHDAATLRRKSAAEVEARRAAHESAFLGKAKVSIPKMTVTAEALDDAGAKSAAAQDALQSFIQNAIVQITEREPDLLAGLDKIVKEADAKRAKAKVLADEAERMEGGTKKLRMWLGRATGRSHLGQFPYERMAVPQADAGSAMTVGELYEQVRPGFEHVPFADDDGSGGAFGTDDPENLDTDDRPWAVDLQEATTDV
jgi:hypothetical protein